jgi:hypothetical protein
MHLAVQGHRPISPSILPLISQRPSTPPTRCAAQITYLDGSNALIGAQQIGAFRLGLADSPESAALQKIVDPRTRLRFLETRELAAGTSQVNAIKRSVCVLSTTPGVPSCVAPAASAAGWDVLVVERARSGVEREADTALAVQMVGDALSLGLPPSDVEVTLLSGDRDFRHAVQMLKSRGFKVDVMAWKHSASPRLCEAASNYIPLDPYFELITFRA